MFFSLQSNAFSFSLQLDAFCFSLQSNAFCFSLQSNAFSFSLQSNALCFSFQSNVPKRVQETRPPPGEGDLRGPPLSQTPNLWGSPGIPWRSPLGNFLPLQSNQSPHEMILDALQVLRRWRDRLRCTSVSTSWAHIQD